MNSLQKERLTRKYTTKNQLSISVVTRTSTVPPCTREIQ